MAETGIALGIDVGGSGIKGAPVDLDRGDFAADRIRIETPEGASRGVCEVIADIVERFDGAHGHAPIGVTIPGRHPGVVRSAANIDSAWIGFDAVAHLHDVLDHPVVVVNDADAAGIGEMYYGAARGHEGLVVLTTLGTGIGTALIHDGVLIPNSELGHLEVDGHDAETRRPRGSGRPRGWAGTSGRRACSATTPTSRRCCGPTSSWSAVGCRRRPTGSFPCSTCGPRSSPPSWRTAPGSSAPPTSPRARPERAPVCRVAGHAAYRRPRTASADPDEVLEELGTSTLEQSRPSRTPRTAAAPPTVGPTTRATQPAQS